MKLFYSFSYINCYLLPVDLFCYFSFFLVFLNIKTIILCKMSEKCTSARKVWHWVQVTPWSICLFSQAPHCEHAFCNACITQWFAQQQICPVDRTVVTLAHLRPVPRIMRNMLSKLQISCENAGFGCTATLRLDQLQSHLKDCEHNPKRPVTCEEGCGYLPYLSSSHLTH